MEKIDFMQEFFKILLDGLKKQGFSVMLLCGGVAGLWFMLQQQKSEMTGSIIIQAQNCERKIEALEEKIDDCDQERRKLEFEVADLRASIRLSSFKEKR